MKKLTTMILDKSLIAKRDLMSILYDEMRRDELINLIIAGKVALYTHNGQRVRAKDLRFVREHGMLSDEGSIAS